MHSFSFFILALIAYVACARTVTVDFYSDNQCTTYANSITLDLGVCDTASGSCDGSCFGWSRSAGFGTTHDDSAHKFECYEDWGILYTQHVETQSCNSNFPSHKESRLSCCMEEASGNLWSLIDPAHQTDLTGCAPVPSHFPIYPDCTPMTTDTTSAMRDFLASGGVFVVVGVIAALVLGCCVFFVYKKSTKQETVQMSDITSQ